MYYERWHRINKSSQFHFEVHMFCLSTGTSCATSTCQALYVLTLVTVLVVTWSLSPHHKLVTFFFAQTSQYPLLVSVVSPFMSNSAGQLCLACFLSQFGCGLELGSQFRCLRLSRYVPTLQVFLGWPIVLVSTVTRYFILFCFYLRWKDPMLSLYFV